LKNEDSIIELEQMEYFLMS